MWYETMLIDDLLLMGCGIEAVTTVRVPLRLPLGESVSRAAGKDLCRSKSG
ncbi:MAG: hypothetical protein ABIT07_04130 [Ferruginibacter sp.]